MKIELPLADGVTTDMDEPSQAPAVDTTAWTRALDVAFEAVARDTLGVGTAEVEPDAQLGDAKNVRGAYISLVDGDTSVLLGLRGARPDCVTVTRYMMAMDEDETVEDEDVTGVIAELMNIVAGVVKSEIGSAHLRLGIPMVVSGRVSPASQQEVASRVVTLGDARFEVLILRRARRPAVRRLRHAG